jgi:hypothetical protein
LAGEMEEMRDTENATLILNKGEGVTYDVENNIIYKDGYKLIQLYGVWAVKDTKDKIFIRDISDTIDTDVE